MLMSGLDGIARRHDDEMGTVEQERHADGKGWKAGG